jgi:diguanylate cyclase (GGDEF)-like protein/PAS domain S-box-containing protein
MKDRNPLAAALSSGVVSTIASTVLLASALPLAAIGWMLFSGSATLLPAVVLALATLAVDTVLVMRIVKQAAAPAHPDDAFFDTPAPARASGDDHHDVDWTWQIDTTRNLTSVSPRLARALGKEPAELEGRSFLQLIAGEAWASGDFAPALHTVADKIKAREAFDRVVLPVSVGGETLWWELSGAPYADQRGVYAGYKGTGADVTTARRTADKINRMARFDTLTGLPNRLQMTEALGEALEAAERWKNRCGFMIIDLDRFKGVNDTLGHAVGDRLLNRVAERLTSLVSENELCGRLGGDEFGVVVQDASDQARVDQLAKRIIDELSKAYDVDNHTLYVGASVGTAIGPRDGNTAETLIRSADLALYRSKDSGGNAHHPYEPQLHADAEERRVMEIALRRALANNEFHLQYQPVVSAETGTVEGFEALLRWTNKQLGSVPPSKFVPLAEEARLIGPIGQWVLRTACQEAMNWPPTVRVAVNVSAEQLHDLSFAKAVASALHDTGLPPHRLELEVTESVFMEEATHAVSVLKEVLALGIKLSLDDFGTGYSSLGYLSRTKFSNIKIDRSFVQGAARNVPENVAIIRAVIALADSLGMSTTAEGVETEEELAMIRGLGCRKIQGYLFGRPMSAHDARALFSSGTRTAAA